MRFVVSYSATSGEYTELVLIPFALDAMSLILEAPDQILLDGAFSYCNSYIVFLHRNSYASNAKYNDDRLLLRASNTPAK